MARIAMDTRAQNSWKELIEKEAATRIQCKLRLEETKKANKEEETASKSKKRSIRPPVILDLANENETSANNADFMKPIVYPPRPVRKNLADEIECLTEQLRLSGANLLSDMRPVTNEVRDELFDGFSKEGKGRSKYLRTRKSDAPEEKYEYPLVSSFDYGWKLNDVYKQEYKNPIHGRNKIVEESFYRRNGVF